MLPSPLQYIPSPLHYTTCPNTHLHTRNFLTFCLSLLQPYSTTPTLQLLPCQYPLFTFPTPAQSPQPTRFNSRHTNTHFHTLDSPYSYVSPLSPQPPQLSLSPLVSTLPTHSPMTLSPLIPFPPTLADPLLTLSMTCVLLFDSSS